MTARPGPGSGSERLSYSTAEGLKPDGEIVGGSAIDVGYQGLDDLQPRLWPGGPGDPERVLTAPETWLGKEPDAYRSVALLGVTGDTPVVGLIRIAHLDDVVRLRVEYESDPQDWSGGDARRRPPAGGRRPRDRWWSTEWSRPDDDSPQAQVAALAKALAQKTRHNVRELRAARSKLEATLARIVRGDAAGDSTESLAALIEIARAANRARELCREGVREGLGAHHTRSGRGPYHQYRSHRDPALVREPAPIDLLRTPWMKHHDLAVRHLEIAAERLGEEADQIYRLLGGVATSTALREAKAQENLNVIVACAAVGLGVPSLVFALYGAEVLVPFADGSQLWVLGLVLSATAFAAVVVVRSAFGGRELFRGTARGKASRKAGLWSVAGIVALGGFLLLTGDLGPQESGARYDCKPGAQETLICTVKTP